MKKAVVLSSGGLDSTTVMAIVIAQGYELFSLSFAYGQRHQIELQAAAKIARVLKASRHLVLDISLDKIGGSSLTDDIDVPKAGVSATEIPPHLCPGQKHNFSLLCPGLGRDPGSRRHLYWCQCH